MSNKTIVSLSKSSTKDDILNFVKEVIDDSVPAVPPISELLNLDANINSILVHEESVDEFYATLFEELGSSCLDDKGQPLFDSLDLENENGSPIDELWESLEEQDGTISEIVDILHEFIQSTCSETAVDSDNRPEITSEDFYSFRSPEFQRYISLLRKHKPSPASNYMGMDDIISLKLGSSLNYRCSCLLNYFIHSAKSGTELQYDDIILYTTRVVHNIHKIFEHLRIEELVKRKLIPSNICLTFNNGRMSLRGASREAIAKKDEEFLSDLEDSAEMLTIIASELMNDISEDIQIDSIDICKKCSMCLAICNTLLTNCGTTMDEITKKFTS